MPSTNSFTIPISPSSATSTITVVVSVKVEEFAGYVITTVGAVVSAVVVVLYLCAKQIVCMDYYLKKTIN